MADEIPPTPMGRVPGAYVAAMLSAAIGLLVLALVQVGTVLRDSFKEFVFDLGKALVPNAEGIGPYSGKEVLLVVGWLGSWAALHFSLRKKDLPVRSWFGATLGILFLATLLMWPPVWHLLKGG